MFLILLYIMGLATTMLIQIGLMHPSPNISQLMCPYLTSSVGVSSISKIILNKILKFCAVPGKAHMYLKNKYQSTHKLTGLGSRKSKHNTMVLNMSLNTMHWFLIQQHAKIPSPPSLSSLALKIDN
jgi:hypothetical protein